MSRHVSFNSILTNFVFPYKEIGVMVKALVYGMVLYEFELQSQNYVHFRTNTLGEYMNPLIFPSVGLIVPVQNISMSSYSF